MTFLKKMCAALLLTCLFAFAAQAAERATMTADTLNYDMNTKKITASGSVELQRAAARLYADYGEGATENAFFELRGNVRGTFPEYQANLDSAQSVKWTESHLQGRDGTIEAFGGVSITRGNGDYLKADFVKWELGTEEYMAQGNVDMLYDQRALKAAEVGRKDRVFWAKRVAQYKDLKENTSLAANRVDGEITANGEVSQVVATGSVRVDYVDREGYKTRLTGEKAVYSKARGTVVISGGAKAVRSDGKVVTADTMVLHETTKNIEAIGRSSISFEIEDKKNEGKK